MASGLAKAASKFDAAFAALPANVRIAAMLAIHRAAPAIEQYQRDLQPLTESPDLLDALWDLAIVAGFRLGMKGKDAFGEKQIADMREAAPATWEFIQKTGQLLQGILPGFNAPMIDAVATRAIAPPDAELIEK